MVPGVSGKLTLGEPGGRHDPEPLCPMGQGLQAGGYCFVVIRGGKLWRA